MRRRHHQPEQKAPDTSESGDSGGCGGRLPSPVQLRFPQAPAPVPRPSPVQLLCLHAAAPVPRPSPVQLLYLHAAAPVPRPTPVRHSVAALKLDWPPCRACRSPTVVSRGRQVRVYGPACTPVHGAFVSNPC